MNVQAFTPVRTTAAYDRVRLPVQRLLAALENECRDQEADALRDILASNAAQRAALVDCHQRLRTMSQRLQLTMALDGLRESVNESRAA